MKYISKIIIVTILTISKLTFTEKPDYYSYYGSSNNNVPGRYYTVDFFGVPQTYFVTPKDQAKYAYNAYVHRYWNEDDMFDKMYYDRPSGGIEAEEAGMAPDDDFDILP